MNKILMSSPDSGFRNRYFTLLTPAYDFLAVSKRDRLIEIIQSEKPALVFLEIESNSESFNRLQKLTHFFETVPMIVFLSSITPEIEKAGFAAGAKEVLSKNLEETQILDLIQKFLVPKKTLLSPSEPKEDKILIVDDEESIRSLLQTFFNGKGHKTLAAKNGEEAIRIVQSERPSVVLLDMNMPGGMNGLETLRRIKEVDPEIGVVMATGVGDEEIAKQAQQYGAYHYVLKPFDLKYMELVVLTRMTLAV